MKYAQMQKREPDFYSPSRDGYLALRMWIAEGVLAFQDDTEEHTREDGWIYYNIVTINNNNMTAKEYLEYILGDDKHPHHKIAYTYIVENEVLRG